MIEELRTNHRNVGQPCRSSDAQVDSYPTSESPFDSSGHVIAQFSALCNAPLILTISISGAAICPAGSW
jgi:hypothetical protein